MSASKLPAARNQRMSNVTRRQHLGLGATANGGSAGSFASHERAAAAPPSAVQQDLDESVERARQAELELTNTLIELQHHIETLGEFRIAAAVRKHYPNAASFNLQEDEDGNRVWTFGGIADAHGDDIEVSDQHEDEFFELAVNAPHEITSGPDNYSSRRIDLEQAIKVPDLGRRFIDSAAPESTAARFPDASAKQVQYADDIAGMLIHSRIERQVKDLVVVVDDPAQRDLYLISIDPDGDTASARIPKSEYSENPTKACATADWETGYDI